MNRMTGIFFVLIATLCEAFGHIAFKQAADTGKNSPGVLAVLAAVLRQYKPICTGLSFFVSEAVFWTLALRFIDVSQAYPISSIELIVMLLLSRVMLKEAINRQRWAGVALIVCGTVLVGLS